jgi:hypothetical protein
MDVEAVGEGSVARFSVGLDILPVKVACFSLTRIMTTSRLFRIGRNLRAARLLATSIDFVPSYSRRPHWSPLS